MTQVKSVMGRRSRLERTLYGMGATPARTGQRDLTSEELRIARRMARQIGCTYEMVARAINWDRSVASLRSKLMAVNIRCVRSKGRISLHLRTYETRG